MPFVFFGLTNNPSLRTPITLFMIMLVIGCSQHAENHQIFNYYPPKDVFEQGFVSKYYYHYYPDNKDRSAATEVRYTKYIKLNGNQFRTENYNAGFDLVSERCYQIQGDTLILDHGTAVNPRNVADTSEMNLLNKSILLWEGKKEEPYQVKYSFNGKDYLYTEYQTSAYDSTIENKPAKVFENEWNYLEVESDSIINEGTSSSFYVQDLGFYGSQTKGPDYRRHMELVEQMSLEEFEKRASHGEHRVAWIDPDQTISDDTGFEICGHEREIKDYYWSNPDARYLHGKRSMIDSIFSNLDTSKLFNQNGRLVFRFVVNCKGEAGRFIAKGYDLEYKPLQFRQETIDHLYSVLRKLDKWEAVLFGDDLQDAYFYITFNIENGEIIDILP